MLIQVATTTPAWLTVVASLGSGTLGGVGGFWQARKLIPAQRKELEATVQKLAMDTAESALKVARERIESLEHQVAEMTDRIGKLHDELAATISGQRQASEQLTFTLVERAKLQQQIMDLMQAAGAKGRDPIVTPPDAIVMMDLTSGAITYANDGVFDLLGYVPSELVGKPLELLVPEAKRVEHTKDRVAYAEAPRTRKMGTGLPLQARTAGGDTISVDISLHPTGDGRVLALVKRRSP